MSGAGFHVHGPHDHELEHAAQHGDKDRFAGTIALAALVVFGLSSWALTTLGVGAWWLWTRKAPRDAQPPSAQP